MSDLDTLARRLTEALDERDKAMEQSRTAWAMEARKTEAVNGCWRRILQLTEALKAHGAPVPKWPQDSREATDEEAMQCSE